MSYKKKSPQQVRAAVAESLRKTTGMSREAANKRVASVLTRRDNKGKR